MDLFEDNFEENKPSINISNVSNRTLKSSRPKLQQKNNLSVVQNLASYIPRILQTRIHNLNKNEVSCEIRTGIVLFTGKTTYNTFINSC